MLRSCLKQIKSRITGNPVGKSNARVPGRRSRRTLLTVECLEDRQLPSTTILGFTLNNSGNLYNPAGTQVDTGVEKFAIVNNTVVDLHYDEMVQSMYTDGSGKVTIGSAVTSFGIAGNGDVIMLTTAGTVAEHTLTSTAPDQVIGGNVTAIGIAGNGDVIMLTTGDTVAEHTPHGSGPDQVIGGGVTAIGIAGNGDVIMLTTGDTVAEHTPHGSGPDQVIGGGVTAIGIAGNGDVIMLTTGNTVAEHTPHGSGPDQVIGGGVTKIGIAGNGAVIMLTTGNTVAEHTPDGSGPDQVIGGGVTAIGIAGNGDVIMLTTGNTVAEHTPDGSGPDQVIGGGVTAIGIASNGGVIMLNSSGQVSEQIAPGVPGSVQLGLSGLNVPQWDANQSGYSGAVVASFDCCFSEMTVTGLPQGLNAALSGNTILFSGTPTQTGTFSNFAVTWSVANLPWATVSAKYSITIVQPPSLGSSLSQSQWTVNQPLIQNYIPLNYGTGPFTSTAIGLPPGLSAAYGSGAVVLSGTPTQSGTFNFALTVQDSGGGKVSNIYPLTINPPPSLGATLSTTQWTANQSGYPGSIAISGGTAGYGVTATGLPPGLNAVIEPNNTVAFSGAPSTAGTYTFALTVGDKSGATANGTYTLTVTPASSLTLGQSLSYQAGSTYTTQLTATGGFGNYAFKVYSGTFPTQLTLSNTGVLNGAVTRAGTYTLAVQATDNSLASLTGIGVFTINVYAAPASKVTLNAPQVTENTPFAMGVTAYDPWGNGVTGTATITIGNIQTVSVNVSNGSGSTTVKIANNGTLPLAAHIGGASSSTQSITVNAPPTTPPPPPPTAPATNGWGTTVYGTYGYVDKSTGIQNSVGFSYTTLLPGYTGTDALTVSQVRLAAVNYGITTVLPMLANRYGPGNFQKVYYTDSYVINSKVIYSDPFDGGGIGNVPLDIVTQPVNAPGLVVRASGSVTAGSAAWLTVTAVDASGNATTGYTGTVSFSSSDGMAGLPGSYTFTAADQGSHTFTVTLETAGTQTVTAADNTGLGSGLAIVQVAPAVATSFALGTPALATAGAPAAVSVMALDAYGNMATGYTGTVSFSSSDQQAGLPASYTFTAADQGSHAFTLTLNTAGSQTVTATDSADGTSAQATVQVKASPVSIATAGAGIIVAEFAGQGVWRYVSGSGWKQLTVTDASTVGVDASGDVVGEFQGRGVWRYLNSTSTWSQLTKSDASQVGIDDNADVVGAFPGQGVWRFLNSTSAWTQLTATAASWVSIAGAGIVAGEFPGQGVWRYGTGSGWKQLTVSDATQVAVDASGDVVGEFLGQGVWRYLNSTGGWSQLTATDAISVSIAGSGNVAGEFVGAGVWRYEDATGWQRLTSTNATEAVIDANGDVAGEFSGHGVWGYLNSTSDWTQLTATDAAG